MNAAALHHQATVVDAHCDVVLSLEQSGREFSNRSGEGHVDLPRLAEGGVDVQVLAICTRPGSVHGDNLRRGLVLLDRLRQTVAANPGRMVLVRNRADLRQRQGRVAAVLALEGGEPLHGELALLRLFYELGVRVLTLTWNLRNELADGIMEQSGSGLTVFGTRVVSEMNRLGMLVDVSHLSERGLRDTLELARPVIASHSCARALCAHPRNLSDPQLQAIAAGGGVTGVTFVSEFIDQDPDRADVDRVVDHIVHIATVAGINHVGLGTDFDGTSSTPRGLEDVSCLPRLTERMLARGLSPAETEAVLGRNLLRVLAQVLPPG